MKIKVYFCDSDNFGDALNRYIYDKCFGVEVIFSDVWNADYAGIGSIADHFLLQIKDIFKSFKHIIHAPKTPVIFLSCGFARANDYYCERLRFFKGMFLKRKINPLSLRGELTRAQLISIVPDIDLSDTVVGDLGLLALYLLPENSEKIYDLGICPHYADRNASVFKQIHDEIPNSILLNTMDDPLEFLKKLSQCKTVISTGLHPLIAADSLGIPNAWCRISEKTTTRHKYYDYYSVFPLKAQPINLLEEKISPDKIVEKYQISFDKVEDIKRTLYDHHKKFFKEAISIIS